MTESGASVEHLFHKCMAGVTSPSPFKSLSPGPSPKTLWSLAIRAELHIWLGGADEYSGEGAVTLLTPPSVREGGVNRPAVVMVLEQTRTPEDGDKFAQGPVLSNITHNPLNPSGPLHSLPVHL